MGCSDFCIFLLIGMSLISNTKGNTENVYISNVTNSWAEARKGCNMVGKDNVSSIPLSQGKVWVDVAVTYTPWVDYLGCFVIKEDKLVVSYTTVSSGEQLRQCLKTCSGYSYFGLQKSRCFCLPNTFTVEPSSNIDYPCIDKSVCNGDSGAFCVDNNEELKLSIYQKVTIAKNLYKNKPHNCLSVSQFHAGQKYYWIADCNRQLSPICSDVSYHPSYQFVHEFNIKKNWTESARFCNYLVPFSYYNRRNVFGGHQYCWLGTIRRPVFKNHPKEDAQPQFCVAVEIQRSGEIARIITNCETKLPALCSITQTAASEEGMETGGSVWSNELMIALVVASTLTIVVFVVIIILCVRLRRSHIRSGHKPLSPTTSEVVYAKVNKPAKEKSKDNVTSSKQEDKQCLVEYAMVNKQHKTVPSIEEEKLDETYDHMNHNRSNSIVKEVGNEYDTMESVRIMNATVHQDSHDEQYLNVQTNQPNTSDHRTEDAEDKNRMDII